MPNQRLAKGISEKQKEYNAQMRARMWRIYGEKRSLKTLVNFFEVSREDWENLKKAGRACEESDPDLFFPVGVYKNAAKDKIQEATDICRKCLGRVECLWFALKWKQQVGIWGGFTEEERETLYPVFKTYQDNKSRFFEFFKEWWL